MAQQSSSNDLGAYVSLSEEGEAPLQSTSRSSRVSQIFFGANAPSGDGLTQALVTTALIICMASFQFGYHTGELNSPKDLFTGCRDVSVVHGTPDCIKMSDSEFSAVTGMFPAGGILGSLIGGNLMDRLGRKGILTYNNLLLIIGSIVMTFSNSVFTMLLGRFLVGVGGGITLVVVPAYLAEIAPLELRGLFGILNQLALVSGIVVSQSVGLKFSDLDHWRYILSGGIFISLATGLGLPWCPESPWFLMGQDGHFEQAEKALKLLRNKPDVSDEMMERGIYPTATSDHTPSYTNGDYGTLADASSSTPGGPLSLSKLALSRHYRPALLMLLFLHLTQQMSGINAVMYYSTSILATTFGDNAKFVTVLINVFQLLLTFVASQIVERWGRRTLMIVSSAFMGVFSGGLAFAINHNYTNLSAIFLFLSVGSFALGLGPLPFLLASELFDATSVGPASALGLTTNLAFNFGIAATFLPISAMFPVDQPGSVFFIFSIWLLASAGIFYKLLPETRACTPQVNLAALSQRIRSIHS